MAVNLSPIGGVAGQFFTNNGTPLSGGKIFTYAAGTTTPQVTYTSASGSIAHTNPIILDSAGRVPSGEIWLTDGLAYKFTIKDSNDVLIGTYDNVVGINSNFVNFTNEQEIQTATAGQTVFNLTTMQYQPGTNSLSVFVDGVNQYGPGASYAYLETDSDTVTFTTGLHVGAEVKFTTSNLNSSAGSDAFNVSYTPPFTGSVATNVGDKLAQTVSIKDFGAVGDGVTDDTTAVIAAHTYANTVFAEVSYAGCTQVALQANAQIPLQTSVDFAGCQLVILGGINTPPSFSTFNNLYVVTDPACPLVTVTGSVLATNLTAGALFPTLGLFDGHGYAFLECGFQIPNRAETGTTNYQQAFKVNRNGRVSSPLSADISAFAGAITVTYRKTSERRLVIKNVSLMEGAWNNQRVFYIQRCNVEVDNFTMMFTGGTFDNIQNIIKIEHGSDITIRNFISTGRPVTTTAGSYNLDIFGGADIIVDNMNALTGWGATGTNHINGVKFVNCVLNRLDAHGGGHNVFAENCDLHESGMVYGWGGGILSVKNCRLNRCNAIATRGDYGGQFFGDLVVADCETTNNNTATMLVVDLETNPLGASTPVNAPRTITVSNVTRSSSASTTGTTEFVPVRIRIKDASSVVYAPNLIKVDNINYHRGWRFGLRIDTLNMEANPISGGLMQVVCSNIFASIAATSTTGVLDYPSIRVPSSPVQPFFFISDCDNIHLSCQSANNAQVRISDCAINAIAVNAGAAVQPTVLIRDCRLLAPASGYSPTIPVGGSRSGNNNYTTILGCDISATAWDLSLISAAQGNVIRNGTTTPSLPSGVTVTDIFAGWRAAGAFQ